MKPRTLSDAALIRAVRGLREEVAAPQGFAEGIMARLKPAPVQAESSAWKQWFKSLDMAWTWKPAAGLAAAAALTLTVITQVPTANVPTQNVKAEAASLPSAAVAVAPKAQPEVSWSVRPAAPAQVAQAPNKNLDLSAQYKPLPAEPMRSSQVALQPKAQPATNAQVAQAGAKPVAVHVFGAMPQGASSSQARSGFGAAASSAGSQARAAGINPAVPEPVRETPTPTLRLEGNSQVRHNVVHVSKGEAATILFNVEESAVVRVELFDRRGRSAVVLKDATFASGMQSVRFTGQGSDGKTLPAGIYLVRIKGGKLDEQHKVVLIK
jgi:hypothetical protein